MLTFHHFLSDEDGAVTIDWVALTAGILLLGIAVIYAIFSEGVDPLVGKINSSLKSQDLAGLNATLDADNITN